MTVKDYIFLQNITQRKILKYKLCRVVDLSNKVHDLNCEVQDRLLEVSDLRSAGISPSQFHPCLDGTQRHYACSKCAKYRF